MMTNNKIKEIKKEFIHYYVGPNIQPAISIDPGEEIVIETEDCFSSTIDGGSKIYRSENELCQDVDGMNPLTGPVAVNHAEVGDVLAITVKDIELAEKGVTAVFTDAGGLWNPFSIIEEIGPDIKVCKIEDTVVKFVVGSRTIELPTQPFIGTIWTMPACETKPSFVTDAVNCGNVDCPELAPSSKLFLPVSVPGGMLSLGDVHACQGDGEITGIAIEAAAKVYLKIDLIKVGEKKHVNCPQLETENEIGSIGSYYSRPLDHNIRFAFQDMVMRMHKFYGFKKIEAYELLGQVAKIRVHQVLDNWNSALVKIDKKYL